MYYDSINQIIKNNFLDVEQDHLIHESKDFVKDREGQTEGGTT
jgi:hypothetical protein